MHWLIGRAVASALFCYVHWIASTDTLVNCGAYRWPQIPPGSVLAMWHGNAPSLVCAFVAKRPSMPSQILVSTDPRGDYLSLLCSWLGFKVVRGDAEHGGWSALAALAEELCQGASVVITADGGGPVSTAKIGAVVLASSVHAPLIPVGANCRPAILESHKWDAARNPLPYSRLSVICGEPVRYPEITDIASLENARRQLQQALNQVSQEAQIASSNRQTL